MISSVPIKDIRRIDVAMEGNWSQTVTSVWTKYAGFIGFEKVEKENARLKPSVELYFDDYWLGIHCYNKVGGKNVFDEKLAMDIIGLVEKALRP